MPGLAVFVGRVRDEVSHVDHEDGRMRKPAIELLTRALLEWGGPARCSAQLAVGMGRIQRALLIPRLRKSQVCGDTPDPLFGICGLKDSVRSSGQASSRAADLLNDQMTCSASRSELPLVK